METVAFFMAQSGMRQVDLAEKSGLGKPYISNVVADRYVATVVAI